MKKLLGNKSRGGKAPIAELSSNDSSSRLCDSCQQFWQQPFEQHNSRLTHKLDECETYEAFSPKRTTNDLVASIKADCLFCSLYTASIYRVQLSNGSRSRNQAEHALKFLLKWDKKLQEFQDLRVEFWPHGEHHFHWGHVPLIPDNTAGEDCWKFALEKLKICSTTHKTCSTYSEGANWCPTRLLDISNPKNIHLVDHSSLPDQNVSYIALSHRWRAGIPTLTCANMKRRLENIPLRELTQVFRDAITASRRLNSNYLWIDSLCIIQDSKEDWEKESALMGEVYRRCLCNISATAASNGSSGLFVSRNSTSMSPFKLEISWRGRKTSYACARTEIWDADITNSSLNRRGWVIQERLLSPITISFGTQIFWECHELEACETLPNGFPKGRGRENGSPNMLGPKTWLQDIGTPFPNSAEPYQVWKTIVRSYTNMGLTKDEDRLVALSGIAQQIQIRLGGSYCAGLWRRDILSQLLWYSIRPRHAQRPIHYRAPSWSWASVEGPVAFPCISRPGPELCRLLEVRVLPKTNNAMGQIVSGHLKISALMCQLSEHYDENNVGAAIRSNIVWDVWHEDRGEANANHGPLYAVPIMAIDNCLARNRRVLMALVVQCASLAAVEFKRIGLMTLSIREPPPIGEVDIQLRGRLIPNNDNHFPDRAYEVGGVRWEDGAWISHAGEPCGHEATITLI